LNLQLQAREGLRTLPPKSQAMTILPTDIPSEAPVMVLPSTLLFPQSLMPLYIFEERYQAMLEWALTHDRAFCVALRKPDVDDAVTESDFFQIAGLGMVRACVRNKNGTSHLMLQGISRVRFTAFTQVPPFRIAKLTAITTELGSEAQTAPLVAEIRALCKRFRSQGMGENIEAFLVKMQDAEMLADAVSHSLIQDPLRRQAIIEEVFLPKRLELVIRAIEAETDHKKKSNK
jgi:Lon protease-like protein